MDDRLRDVEVLLARVRQRVDDHEQDFVRFAPVVHDLHEVKWMLKDVEKDLSNAYNAIRELSAKLDEEREERIRGQAERKQELEEATAARDAEIKRMEIAREAQAKELRSRLHVATLALAGVFMTTLGTVVVSLLTGGGS